MSNAVLSHPMQPKAPAGAGKALLVSVVLAVWFALVGLLGARGAFVTAPGAPPVPLAIGVMAPIILFLAALWISQGFRAFVLSLDPHLMMGIQAWRFAGFGFLALYANGVLPGLFAWPAGLGDIAIGVTAPWLLVALVSQPNFASSKTFVLWNVLGMLDLVVAVGTGALGSALAAGVASEVTTRPMAELPLILIPAFLVPIFAMLHVAAVFQALRLARNSAARG